MAVCPRFKVSDPSWEIPVQEYRRALVTNLIFLNALFLRLLRFRTFCFLICVNKEVQRAVSRRRRRKGRNKKRVFRELKFAVLMESPPKWSTMGRNRSPLLRQELANLDKDADSRKSAMKALKLYVKGLDSEAIPQFLAQVSETKETGSLSGARCVAAYFLLI